MHDQSQNIFRIGTLQIDIATNIFLQIIYIIDADKVSYMIKCTVDILQQHYCHFTPIWFRINSYIN